MGKQELNFQGTPIYFDVEGIPDMDFYYLIGVRIGNGKPVQHSFWADDLNDEPNIWTQLLNLIQTVENPVLIHYGSYETTFIKSMRERYGSPQDDTAAGRAISSSINLLSFIFGQIYFPTYSNGLKEIAGYLGFKWAEASASGLQALEWRERWEQSKFAGYRQKLITYNAQDCEALDSVAGAIQFLLGEPRPDGPQNSGEQFVWVDQLKEDSRSRWCEFNSPIKELVEITECAHWDYQRSRVYFRSSKVIKRLQKRPLPKPAWRVDQIRDVPPVDVCPTCGNKGIPKGHVQCRSVQELISGRFSLKRRLVKYRHQPYWCGNCKMQFGVDPVLLKPGKRRKYGRSLLAYLFYHTIELHVPASVAIQSANRMFGLALATGTYAGFKPEMAAYYAATQEQIIARIVAGHLVHADETYVSIKGKRAYVWVFTNMHEVAYVYSATREASVLQGILKDFKEVLLSDFYAAYDGLKATQQKCLIHLARDLNGELLDHPFDDELKAIIQSFSILVRAIVGQIDQHGLKRHFLHKYVADVKRFYRQFVDVKHESPAATDCAERFQRNRDRLFTFLDYDGIPWNNNNAEHAMKAFAGLRDVMDGCPTESSIRETLILLSICQTCKYQGLDFLNFLRSGEKDIEAFATTRGRARNRVSHSSGFGGQALDTSKKGESARMP